MPNPEKVSATVQQRRVRPAAWLGWAAVMVAYRIAPQSTTRLVALVALKAQERRLDHEREEATRPRLF